MLHRTETRRPTEDCVDHRLVESLRELIAALDRRVPRLERAAEADIARDAAELRREARERIADLREIQTR